MEWKYEPQGYELESYGCYLPDFKLPNLEGLLTQTAPARDPGLWVEVKGGEPTKDELGKIRALARKTPLPSAVVCGVQDESDAWLYPHGGGQPMKTTTVNLLSYLMAHNFRNALYGECLEAESALKKGRSARFEHGEKPV